MDNCVSLGWIDFLSSHHALCHDSFVSCRLNHMKQALIVRWEDVAGAENMILIVKQAEVVSVRRSLDGARVRADTADWPAVRNQIIRL